MAFCVVSLPLFVSYEKSLDGHEMFLVCFVLWSGGGYLISVLTLELTWYSPKLSSKFHMRNIECMCVSTQMK